MGQIEWVNDDKSFWVALRRSILTKSNLFWSWPSLILRLHAGPIPLGTHDLRLSPSRHDVTNWGTPPTPQVQPSATRWHDALSEKDID
mgnify:CR=1 FL=1